MHNEIKMNYLTADHVFFSTNNMQVLLQHIHKKLNDATDSVPGTVPEVTSDEIFVTTMLEMAQKYPQHLMTVPAADGVARLNDAVARRYVALLTVPEEAGQYYPNNILYQQTRKALRVDSDADDFTVQGSAVVLGGNVYHRRNQELLQQARAAQPAYLAQTVALSATDMRDAPQDMFKE